MDVWESILSPGCTLGAHSVKRWGLLWLLFWSMIGWLQRGIEAEGAVEEGAVPSQNPRSRARKEPGRERHLRTLPRGLPFPPAPLPPRSTEAQAWVDQLASPGQRAGDRRAPRPWQSWFGLPCSGANGETGPWLTSELLGRCVGRGICRVCTARRSHGFHDILFVTDTPSTVLMPPLPLQVLFLWASTNGD